MTALLDTHAHLDEYEDIDTVVRQAKEAGLSAVIGVGLDIPSNEKTFDIAGRYPDFVYPAIGWYPSNVDALKADEHLAWLDANLHKAIAIGEIGLDYLGRIREKVPRELQKSVLADLLALAIKHDKPALLHTRYAWKDALNIAERAGLEKAVFHSFTGPSSVLRGILARGYHVSVTPAVDYNAEMQRVVKETPLESLLLETDCPIVFKAERTGDEPPATPADIRISLAGAARLKGISEDELAAVTTENAMRLFRIDNLCQPY